MATSLGPDLSAGVAALERLMDDVCLVTRDAESVGDDVLNEATGELEPPDDDTNVVYGPDTVDDDGEALDGKCKIAPWGQDQPQNRQTGLIDERPRWYRLTLPLRTPVANIPIKGDRVVITSSRRDSWLLTQEFIVKEQMGSSMAVSRRLMVELVQ